jgi:hypothetical protein
MNGTCGVNVIVVAPTVRHVPGTLGTMLGRVEPGASAEENLTEIGAVPPIPPAPSTGVVETTRRTVVAVGRGAWRRRRAVAARVEDGTCLGAEAAALVALRWMPA